jgi:CheY-like chemotaxis protein
VVVDHDMPEMNGFELCQNLKDFPVKKIMLTGVASHAKAVQAFNAGIIDRFIDKGSPELFTLLNTAIAELQEIYYREQSQSLIQTILNQADTCVVNPEFQALFKQLCQQKNIAEFYQLDVTGSFLLLDYEGKITWLFVKSRQEMEDYLDIATENSAPQTIIDALKNKQKLPFFLTPEDYQLPFDQWQPYLHAAQQLGNGEKYYYAVMEGEACYKVFGGRVVSHGGYLGQLCSLATEI